MSRFWMLLFSTLPVFAAGSSNTSTSKVVPLVIVGEGWSQRIILQNVDTRTRAVGLISFYTKDGAPWTVRTSNGNAALVAFDLQPGQAFTLDTEVSAAPQTLGWARITQDTAGIGRVFGQTVFRKQTPGAPDFMCSLVLGAEGFERTTTFFDNTDGRFTGMGVLTSTPCRQASGCPDVRLRLMVKDFGGNTVGQRVITQKAGALYWMNLGADFPETVGRSGVFVVEPADALVNTVTSFSLQFGANGAFTAIVPFEQ